MTTGDPMTAGDPATGLEPAPGAAPAGGGAPVASAAAGPPGTTTSPGATAGPSGAADPSSAADSSGTGPGAAGRSGATAPALVLATTNRAKAAELARLLAEAAGLPALRVKSLADFPPLPEVIEDSDTYEANAGKKARAVAAALGLPALADDSGLEVDALGGRPGLQSARYLGPGASPRDQVAGLLRELAGVPPPRRTARFVCALVLALPDGREVAARGVVEGTIAEAPRGEGGFGYDPIFVPRGETRTYAEMPAEEKARTSHRAAAARALAPALGRLIGT